MTYALIWEFRVKPGQEKAFEGAYGSDGDWVRLFREDASFAGTYLFRDSRKAGRYVTLDLWESGAAYALFRATYKDEYAAIDAKCEALTLEERELGRFATVDRGEAE